MSMTTAAINGSHPASIALDLIDCILDDKDGNPIGINHDITARWILQNHHIIHIIETENTLSYQNGVYENFAENHLKVVLFEAFENHPCSDGSSLISAKDINEVLARVRAWSSESISTFDNDEPIFNMSNGILNVDTIELMPHSHELKLITKSPVTYDPNADCPRFMDFMNNSLEPIYHPLISEFIGYILWPEYHIHKAFMFLGPLELEKVQ
jgi:phage/plasmid-associated DNA primase